MHISNVVSVYSKPTFLKGSVNKRVLVSISQVLGISIDPSTTSGFESIENNKTFEFDGSFVTISDYNSFLVEKRESPLFYKGRFYPNLWLLLVQNKHAVKKEYLFIRKGNTILLRNKQGSFVITKDYFPFGRVVGVQSLNEISCHVKKVEKIAVPGSLFSKSTEDYKGSTDGKVMYKGYTPTEFHALSFMKKNGIKESYSTSLFNTGPVGLSLISSFKDLYLEGIINFVLNDSRRSRITDLNKPYMTIVGETWKDVRRVQKKIYGLCNKLIMKASFET